MCVDKHTQSPVQNSSAVHMMFFCYTLADGAAFLRSENSVKRYNSGQLFKILIFLAEIQLGLISERHRVNRLTGIFLSLQEREQRKLGKG